MGKAHLQVDECNAGGGQRLIDFQLLVQVFKVGEADGDDFEHEIDRLLAATRLCCHLLHAAHEQEGGAARVYIRFCAQDIAHFLTRWFGVCVKSQSIRC